MPLLGPEDFAGARAALVRELSTTISDRRVLDAFGRVPRERFVPHVLQRHAYDNRPLPIGKGQTISQPLVVAIMLEALDVQPTDHVLDVGTGSGYQAALLAELGASVISVERLPDLAARAASVLEGLGYRNITVAMAAATLGLPDAAPYDAIAVAAAAPEVPATLVDQLAVGGRLVLPVGEQKQAQELMLVRKTAEGVSVTSRGPCGFVPLIGEGAFEGDLGEGEGSLREI